MSNQQTIPCSISLSHLSICTEFSISPEALDALAKFVNAHGSLYDQGMAFGGINGVAIKHIHGDGYWNQVRISSNNICFTT